MIRDALEQVLARRAKRYEEIATAQLAAGEQLIGTFGAETSAPLLLQMLPVVRVLFPTRYYLLAVTDRRLLVIRTTAPGLVLLPRFNRLARSVELANVSGFEEDGKSVRIETRGGPPLTFGEMFESARFKLRLALRVVRERIKEKDTSARARRTLATAFR